MAALSVESSFYTTAVVGRTNPIITIATCLYQSYCGTFAGVSCVSLYIVMQLKQRASHLGLIEKYVTDNYLVRS